MAGVAVATTCDQVDRCQLTAGRGQRPESSIEPIARQRVALSRALMFSAETLELTPAEPSRPACQFTRIKRFWRPQKRSDRFPCPRRSPKFSVLHSPIACAFQASGPKSARGPEHGQKRL